jgi:hypothetical protein
LQLRTSDETDVSIGFHRSGATACQLRHSSNGLILSGTTKTTAANFVAIGTVTGSNLSGSNTGDQTTNISWTAGTTAGPTCNSSTGSDSAIPVASASQSGVVNTGTQYFIGIKSFNSQLRASHIDTNTGAEVIITAGESASVQTGLTGESVYLVAESGLQVISHNDNWITGWTGRNTCIIKKRIWVILK